MPLSPLRLRILVVSLLTVSFLGALDHTVVSTSLATVAGELGALEQMAWVVVGFTLAATVLLPVIGKLGDVVGPRRVFLVSLAIFIAASLMCGFSQDMVQLVIARVLQGMSSAGLQLMSHTIVAYVAPPRDRPRLLAIVGAAFPVAIVVGPVLGGLITDFWGWPWVFWINVPVGLAALGIAVFAIPHIAPGARPRFDIAGAVTFTIAMVGLVLGVTWIVDPAASLTAGAAFVIAAVAFAAFLVIELRVDEPIVPLRAFRNRTIAAGVALSAIIGLGLFSVVAYLPTYFQMAYGTSATVSGLVPIATVFGMLVSNLVTGHLASRTGHYRVYPIIGTSLGAAGLFVMALLPDGAPLWVPAAGMAVVGLGTGCFMSLVLAVVQSAVSRGEIGAITATTNLVRQIGATTATAVIGSVIGFGVAARLPAGLDAASLTPAVVHSSSAAVQADVAAIYHDVLAPVFLALSAVYALGIVAALMLPGGTLSDRLEPEPSTATAAPSRA
ncbi:MFS transporter [Microbacterium hominis]|uniref:MFS transporter n=1 Tax=Microbacterium hominis TaxID=162426 RepID=A0A7D4Q401_9MICO|nr:MFS transporter [Microbacterium hominis]QKJ20391.1 MFS transporter [Microbacterium hominis]